MSSSALAAGSVTVDHARVTTATTIYNYVGSCQSFEGAPLKPTEIVLAWGCQMRASSKLQHGYRLY